MRIQKTKIVDLPWVYATAELNLGGRRYLAAVSEQRDEHAYIIDPETLQYADLWIGDTGVMNVVQVPGRDMLLAITKFYPIFQSKEAVICALEPTEKGYLAPWKIEEVLKLPFCHRIGIVRSENGLFLLGCQLCQDKDFQEDWTKPGALWMAPIPEAGSPWKWAKLYEGLTKNHGLFIERGNQVYICAENGVLRFDLADYRAGDRVEPRIVSETPTSDIWVSEDEGEKIAATIEPFHGDTASVYRLTDTSFEKLASFPIHFGHVVWLGKLFGQSAMIVGNRGGGRTLDIVFWRTGEVVTLDTDVGPTQITVYEDRGGVRILSANHGAGEIALYALAP